MYLLTTYGIEGNEHSFLRYFQEAEHIALKILYYLFVGIDFSFLDFGIGPVSLIHIIGVILAYHTLRDLIKVIPELPIMMLKVIIRTFTKGMTEAFLWAIQRVFFLLKKFFSMLRAKIGRLFSTDMLHSFKYSVLRLWYWFF